jgi:hypothetical protein
MIEELSSALKDFLKVQSIVKKTERDLAKISKQVESSKEFKVAVSKIVKPFTPTNNSDGGARDQKSMNGGTTHASARELSDRLKSLESESILQSKRLDFELLQSVVDFQTQKLLKHRERREEFTDNLRYNGSQDLAKDIPSLTEDSIDYNSDASEKELSRKQGTVEYACMATPTKRSRSKSKSSVRESTAMQSSPQYALTCTRTKGIYVGPSNAWRQTVMLETPTSSVGSPHEAHIAEDDTEFESPRPLQDNDNEDSDSDTSGKFNEEPERPPRQIRRNESKKRGSYIHPTESKEDRSEAGARIVQSLRQVHKSVHSNREGKRDSVTLYVGNLEYNASEQDLREALDPVFQKIRVDKITIPRVNGRSMYAFIDISWAHGAPVKPSDICIVHNSGKLQVNSRPIYFRELRDKSAKK